MPDKLNQLFLDATTAIYSARRAGNWQQIDAILALFDDDARRAVIIGAAALMAIGDAEYSAGMKASICPVIYEQIRQEAKT